MRLIEIKLTVVFQVSNYDGYAEEEDYTLVTHPAFKELLKIKGETRGEYIEYTDQDIKPDQEDDDEEVDTSGMNEDYVDMVKTQDNVTRGEAV